MSIFGSTEELHLLMEELWGRIKEHPGMSSTLIGSKLSVQFRYREPDGRVTIDCTDGAEMKIYTGEVQIKPIVEMTMKADVAHEFWMGKVNVPVAIISGKIVAKGPVNKALALLPVVKPAFQIYPELIDNPNSSKSARQKCKS